MNDGQMVALLFDSFSTNGSPCNTEEEEEKAAPGSHFANMGLGMPNSNKYINYIGKSELKSYSLPPVDGKSTRKSGN